MLHGGGHSLAEMAQRDLDAALQLLTERAQYITGANGAAIALRRNGKKDMLCRAAAGSNAPELGALLSTEFGLSGESVRTRRPLRCDDAERDPRVNREGCRDLGIASVVVMPVVNDDEVLGVFELFSGKANAFGERDLSTLQRLSQMVETAVKLAQAAEMLPLPVLSPEIPLAEPDPPVLASSEKAEAVIAPVKTPLPVAPEIFAQAPAEVTEPAPTMAEFVADVVEEEAAPVKAAVQESVIAPAVAPAVAAPEKPVVPQSLPARKPLFWSVALNPVANAEKPAATDHSNVPPVLRNLSSCQACGFPVSPGRILCVECEEKKWRGQLRSRKPIDSPLPMAATTQPAARAFAAAATSTPVVPAVSPGAGTIAPKPVLERKEESPVIASQPAAKTPETVPAFAAAVPPPAFTLSAGLPSSESWFSSKKYILGTLLLIAAAAAAVWFLR